MKHISATALKPKLTDGGEIAFVDVREHGQYGEGHPFFSVNIPYSLVETRVEALLPCRSVRCVLFDDGDGIAEKAADLLEALELEQERTGEETAGLHRRAGLGGRRRFLGGRRLHPFQGGERPVQDLR